jgi:hypothetical protein
MSLTAVKKRISGVVGREQPTGHTLYKSWDALEQAMTLIWLNARDYNEDGSDIYNVSIELEVRCAVSGNIVLADSSRNSFTSVWLKPRPKSTSLHSQSSSSTCLRVPQLPSSS